MLSSTSILLRPFTEADLVNVFKGLSHPDVIKYYGVSYKSLEETKAQMKFFLELEESGTGIWWAICSPDNKLFYGAGGLNNLKKEHRKAEIGFWLLPEFWGKGLMTEVLPIIFNYGFDFLGLHRIEGFVETENVNSRRVLTKLGFKYEGTMKDCEIKDGRFISLEIFANVKLR